MGLHSARERPIFFFSSLLFSSLSVSKGFLQNPSPLAEKPRGAMMIINQSTTRMMVYRQAFMLHCCRLSSSSSPSSSSSLKTLFWLKPSQQLCRRTRAYGTSSLATTHDEKRTESFFADESITWNSLGVHDKLSHALSNIGLEKPSLIQAACIPFINSGNDVVVAAETGSGKTHGYLVPLINKLCIASESDSTDGNEESIQPHKFSLVLCPNVMLCEQVARMANSLCDDSGEPLLLAAAVCGRQGWPATSPDIVVSTPAALLNYLFAIDPDRRRRSDFLRGVKHVVFDEADMLLCGGFQNQIIRLINLFRFDEKVLSRAKNLKVEGSTESNADSVVHSGLEEDEEEMELEFNSEDDEDDEGSAGPVASEDLKDNRVARNRTRDWKRVRKIYERSKQYIFVAATLPLNGKQTAGGVLKRMFPDASWVSGNYLHCHNPRLEQRWVPVTVETQIDALISAVKHGSESEDSDAETGIRRTMVFANTVDAVESIAKILLTVGIECICYHRDSPLEVRLNNLTDFQERGGVLVCTDAAARGLDVPNVSHVIQAEFASSAVDFLHRIGRTARAGQSGLVTSMYTESNQDLVAAVRQAGKLGQPVEKAFSRKRGFRNKIKKRGPRRAKDTAAVEDKVLA